MRERYGEVNKIKINKNYPHHNHRTKKEEEENIIKREGEKINKTKR